MQIDSEKLGVQSAVDNDVTRMTCKNMYALLSMLSLVRSWVLPGISQVQTVRCINISLAIKCNLKTGMGMDNPVTGLTIK